MATRQGKLHEDWSGAKGLAEDVRRYGAWMREQPKSVLATCTQRLKSLPRWWPNGPTSSLCWGNSSP
jgi:hypothetical protein